MRLITSQIKEAFDAGKSKRIGNTSTDGAMVWLHGNAIIKKENGNVFATLAGWNTPTTKERVNGITGAGFHTVRGEAMRNGEPVSATDWIQIS